MSKGKDGMTPERWEHIKWLRCRDRWFHRGGTYNVGRNAQKRMKAHLKKVKGG